MATAKKAAAPKAAPAKKVEKFELADLTLVKKATFGYFGDPAGYEESYMLQKMDKKFYTQTVEKILSIQRLASQHQRQLSLHSRKLTLNSFSNSQLGAGNRAQFFLKYYIYKLYNLVWHYIFRMLKYHSTQEGVIFLEEYQNGKGKYSKNYFSLYRM